MHYEVTGILHQPARAPADMLTTAEVARELHCSKKIVRLNGNLALKIRYLPHGITPFSRLHGAPRSAQAKLVGWCRQEARSNKNWGDGAGDGTGTRDVLFSPATSTPLPAVNYS